MSDPRYLPTTPEGRMSRLIEECGEVLQAIGKLQRFGPASFHPRARVGDANNRLRLFQELTDLQGAALAVARDLYPEGATAGACVECAEDARCEDAR